MLMLGVWYDHGKIFQFDYHLFNIKKINITIVFVKKVEISEICFK